MLKCSNCDQEAAYVLVSYWHDVVGEGSFFCEEHAFAEGREKCRFCEDYGIEVDEEDENTGEIIELIPTYPAGALDSEGCCSDHP